MGLKKKKELRICMKGTCFSAGERTYFPHLRFLSSLFSSITESVVVEVCSSVSFGSFQKLFIPDNKFNFQFFFVKS